MQRIVKPAGKLALDLHVHCRYSRDSLTTGARLIRAAQERGLDAIAVTDHNTAEGALRLRDSVPFPVIVGEEVKTSEGEIIGLFLERSIPRGLSPQETVAAIREQRGLVYLPHPADSVRRSVLRWESVLAIISTVDIVEVLNARVLSDKDNLTARKLADTYKLPYGAGSDAHTPGEIGQAYALVSQCDFTNAVSFLSAIRESQIGGGLSSPAVHFASTVAKVIKRLGIVKPGLG